ncbi:PREDICTED: serine protease inhibitor I/II-like [Nicrophorus vespilloides]|uniref:Serine protease inhibitor I/II-like n=1 Tax=Nicrophorus vespilloides TaxID=110193 RepID=A0ABM1M758_NICVS|nr:PREDICTED: serine protease inhibitor I/II-like [Nicrophorus vespilloides]
MKCVTLICMFFVVLAIVDLAYSESDCKAGDVKQESCNTCKCVNGGWACTRKRCLEKRQIKCTPRETFKQECNTCICNERGDNAICTLKACL